MEQNNQLQDQSFHEENDRSIEINAIQVEEQINRRQDEFLPKTMKGADYFHQTPVEELSVEGFITRRGRYARDHPYEVAAEFNEIREYLLSDQCKSSKHRAFAETNPVMTRKFVLATEKASRSSGIIGPFPVVPGVGSQGSIKSTSSSTSSSTTNLQEQFILQWRSFSGSPLLLKSGVNVDEKLYHCALALSKQSSLHSGIVDSREFSNYKDVFDTVDLQELVEIFDRVCSLKREHHIEVWQKRVIDYFESPGSVKNIYRKGWDNVFPLVGDEPEGHEEFSNFVFDFVSDVCRFYKQFGRDIGQEFELCTSNMSEKDFKTLWSYFFNALWINDKVIKCNDGEVTSLASTYRRNGIRSLEDNQSRGHKIDSVLTAAKADTEIGAVECGKKNEASYGTKYLNDGVKTAKTLKDMFDIACANAARHGHNIKADMEVYGFILSGLRIEFITLKYVGGRLLFLERRFTDQLPTTLNANTFWTVKDILIKFLLIRKRMEDLANMLEQKIYGKRPNQEEEAFISMPTYSTPPGSPKSTKRRLV